MPYYGRGDFYRGDYYRRGDPGFLDSLKHIVTGVGDVLTGNFGAAAGQAIQAFTGGGTPQAPPPPPGRVTYQSPVGRAIKSNTTFNFGIPYAPVAAMNGCAPKGYHLNKSNEYCQGVVVTPKGTKLVRNRRMNPGNAKALRRADHRAQAFLHMTRKLVRHFRPHAPKGRAYVHTRRRRK